LYVYSHKLSVSSCLHLKHWRLKIYSIQLLIAEKSQNSFSAGERQKSLCTHLSLWLKVHIIQNFSQIQSGAQNAKTLKQNVFFHVTVNCYIYISKHLSTAYAIECWPLTHLWSFNTFTLLLQFLLKSEKIFSATLFA